MKASDAEALEGARGREHEAEEALGNGGARQTTLKDHRVRRRGAIIVRLLLVSHTTLRGSDGPITFLAQRSEL
jgi:hypothetical protein